MKIRNITDDNLEILGVTVRPNKERDISIFGSTDFIKDNQDVFNSLVDNNKIQIVFNDIEVPSIDSVIDRYSEYYYCTDRGMYLSKNTTELIYHSESLFNYRKYLKYINSSRTPYNPINNYVVIRASVIIKNSISSGNIIEIKDNDSILIVDAEDLEETNNEYSATYSANHELNGILEVKVLNAKLDYPRVIIELKQIKPEEI
jgi:hypothetical protein